MVNRDSHQDAAANLESAETGRSAFEAIRAKIEAIPEAEVLVVNTDVVGAVTTVLAAAPRIARHIAELRQLPFFDEEDAMSLSTYAMAAWYADAVATAPVDDQPFTSLLDEAIPLRRMMLVGADALAERGFFTAERVTELRAGNGHHEIAQSLVGLGQLYRSKWAQIENKTAVMPEDVDRAEQLGAAVLRALVERKDGRAPRELMRLRARTFTLLARAYDQCRRAVSFLRWDHRDADVIAPSIYARKRRRSTRDDREAVAVHAPPQSLPVPLPPDVVGSPLTD